MTQIVQNKELRGRILESLERLKVKVDEHEEPLATGIISERLEFFINLEREAEQMPTQIVVGSFFTAKEGVSLEKLYEVGNRLNSFLGHGKMSISREGIIRVSVAQAEEQVENLDEYFDYAFGYLDRMVHVLLTNFQEIFDFPEKK